MFGRKNKHNVRYRDLIWMNATIKVQKLLSQIKEGKPVILVSSFENTLKDLQSLESSLKKLETLAEFDKNGGPWLLNSKLILKANTFQQAITEEIQIIFTEHYPMPDKDHEIITKTATVFKNPTITFYISLEDPLMQIFNSDRIMGIMKGLGIDKNDAIEHQMISKSIVKAQKKLAKKIRLEQQYDKEETWYRMNYIG